MQIRRAATENFHVTKVVSWDEGYVKCFLFFAYFHVYMPLRDANLTNISNFEIQNFASRKSIENPRKAQNGPKIGFFWTFQTHSKK